MSASNSVVLCLLVAIAGCAHKAKTVGIDLSKAGPVTGLALTLDIKGAREDLFNDQCELVLRQGWRARDWSIPINNRTSAVVVALPSGIYQPRVLLCAKKQGYDVSRWRDQFEVHVDRISYVGHVEINAKSPQDVAVGVMAAPQGARDSLRQLIDGASPSRQAAFVSSWTAKPLSSRMLQEKPYTGFEYTWKSSVDIARREWLTDQLKSCEREEIARNRVLLGRLRITALYLKGKFANSQLADFSNTYSDQFIACLQAGFQSFSVKSTEPVSITIDL